MKAKKGITNSSLRNAWEPKKTQIFDKNKKIKMCITSSSLKSLGVPNKTVMRIKAKNRKTKLKQEALL
jgi:hypothetical protein